MRDPRSRPLAVAVALLGLLGLAGPAADRHGHGLFDPGDGNGDLPSFAAAHSGPDASLHVEAATEVEAADCVACLLRHKPRAAVLATSRTRVAHSARPLRPGGRHRPSPGAVDRLPSPRGPPIA